MNRRSPRKAAKPAIPPAASAPGSAESSRRQLLEAAKRLFSRKGLDGTTVKQIADEAGVNVSLVSYYFNGKEGLYRACLDEFGRERLNAARRLLTPPRSLEELRLRLSLFLSEVLSCHADDSDIVQMLHRECESEMALTQDIFEETFLQIFSTLIEFFRSGQKAGLLRKDLDPKVLTASVVGTLTHMGRMDLANRKFFNQTVCDPKYRERTVQQLISLYIDGAIEAHGARS